MKIDFDPLLPISERVGDISAALRDNQVVVIAGETGSGKTTQLPKIAFQLGYRSIAHTQPRRIAARSVARRIADECEVSLGAEVGYAVRFDKNTSKNTAITLMTDGLLLSELQNDRDLKRYDTIIIDEAHERSLAIDFLLGYLKQLLPRRRDLRVIVTSATIDVERFAAMFDAPVIEVSGRTYPVEVRYRPLTESDAADLFDAIGDAINELPRAGDILVFLPGERDIRDTAEYLEGKKYPRTEILPLYGRLAAHDQQKVFSSSAGRRIVLATNVAETSLTVPGIRYVIDPGLARISRFSSRLKVQRLPIEPISQASANQRAGRCGRVADGICIRLYSEEDFDGRPEFTDPEILRTNLASVMLQMSSLQLGALGDFPFLDAPDNRAVNDAVQLLRELGALDGDRLTRLGRSMSSLPLDPRLARMVMAAERSGCLADVLVIVAAMSIQDPRERPLDKQEQADQLHRRFVEPDSDFLSFLTLWRYLTEQRAAMSHNKFRRLCHDQYLHYLRIREWQDVHAQLRRTVKDAGFQVGDIGSDPDELHQALLTGLLSHVGMRQAETRDYLGARGARFRIFPGSGTAKKPPAWVMAGELVETSQLWGRTVARVQPEWIETAGKHLVKRSYSEPAWSAKRGAATAREKVTLYGIPVVSDRVINLSNVDRPLARELFIRHALVAGEWRTYHKFWARNQQRLRDIEDLQDRTRRRDLQIDDHVLFDFYDSKIPETVVSVRHFDSWWKKARQQNGNLLDLDPKALLAEQLGDTESQFPSTWTSQSADYDIEYVFEPGSQHDGIVVRLTLEQLATAHAEEFVGQVPGHQQELVTELIRSLPKSLRRNFTPPADVAASVAHELDSERNLLEDLAEKLSARGTTVRSADFDYTAIPTHLRVTFAVADNGRQLSTGADLEALRAELLPQLQRELRKAATTVEASGLTAWPDQELDERIEAGGVPGYPSLVDEGSTVGVRVLLNPEEQPIAMVRAQSRLLTREMPNPVPQIGRGLDMRAKLLLATAPYTDPAAVIEDCWLAALDFLVEHHGGPAPDNQRFTKLIDPVRSNAFARTEVVLQSVQAALDRLGRLTLTGSEPSEDVQAQLSWLIYPGFIRDMGASRLHRLPIYLDAARARLDTPLTAQIQQVHALEARFYELTAELTPLRQLAPDVAEVRWSLEELRVSVIAQRLKAAQSVSVKRVNASLDELEKTLGS